MQYGRHVNSIDKSAQACIQLPSWQPLEMLSADTHVTHASACIHAQVCLEDMRVSIAALAKAKQEALDHLSAEYYQQEYDSVAGELALLPRMFTEADLESVVEERSGVLEVIYLSSSMYRVKGLHG